MLFYSIGFLDVNSGSVISTGEVKNLGIENVSIVNAQNGSSGIADVLSGCVSNCYVTGNISGDGNLSAIAGVFAGTIENTYAEISISGSSAIGALAGMGMQGVIKNSYAIGDITGTENAIGGLVGNNYLVAIENCWSGVNVSGEFGVGGIVGQNLGGDINKCYSIGELTAISGDCGAIAGGVTSQSSVQNSNWNTDTTGQSAAVGSSTGTESNNKGLTTAEMQNPTNWQGWDTSIWDFSTYPPTFKMYTPTGGGSTGGTDPSDPSNPDNPNTPGGGDVPIPGAVRLQIGSDSCSTSAIYVDTSFDLGAFDVDFSSADSCAAAIEDIDEVLSRINTKRSEFGAVINRLSSILESQTTTIQNFTSAIL